MPYWNERSGRAPRYYYTDPIARADRHDRGLMRVVREPWNWFMDDSRRARFYQMGFTDTYIPFPDKYDLFNEYPIMEQIDYNRLMFETAQGITEKNKRNLEEWYARFPDTEPNPYCCWPVGCVLNAACGATLHWDWRAAFERQLPYWR